LCSLLWSASLLRGAGAGGDKELRAGLGLLKAWLQMKEPSGDILSGELTPFCQKLNQPLIALREHLLKQLMLLMLSEALAPHALQLGGG